MSRTRTSIHLIVSIVAVFVAGILLCSCGMVTMKAAGSRASFQAPILAPETNMDATTSLVTPESSEGIVTPESGETTATPDAGSSLATPEASAPAEATSATSAANPTSAEIAMSLVFDISGSMDDPSGLGGITKLESAKRQSTDFVSSVRRQGSDGFERSP